MAIDYRNGVSIAEIIVYVPILAIAIILAIRHGFGRSSGWLFLIIFSLARIIGPAMQLATISDPTNTSLYTGTIILQSVGLSPLMLATVGLLSRVLDSINRSHKTFLNTHMLRLVQLVIMVGLILGIIGGISASNQISSGSWKVGSLSKAGTALFIVSYVIIVIATIITSFSITHAEPGEKRILLVISVSLPILLIRLIYSIMTTFTNNKNFGQLTGSVTYFLCIALIEEFIIVVLYEAVGLTLHQIPKEKRVPVEATHQHRPLNSRESADSIGNPPQNRGGAGSMAKRIAKKTITGRLITAATSRGKESDVEMGRI